jgi:hypothetical protein
MARVRTVNFLPEIFQTETNKQFLAATLDQLVQEPNFEKIQGYVGRRVGPGVNANDEYVKEETAVRTNYQLEPSVVVKSENSNDVQDVITYPGITDALGLAGSFTNNADRLYTSEYYTWDPFVDFDKLVNYGQYYWLPAGPDAVNVFATEVPLQQTFDVTRKNGVYTFSSIEGTDPTLTLLRGGNYTFNVAQNDKETVNFRVTNNSTNAYVIDYEPNPTLTLVRGNTYVFTLVLRGDFPFYIKTLPTLGTTNQYNGVLMDGSPAIQNNGARTGTITFTVPQDAPDVLYYTNNLQLNMQGVMNIVDAQPGTGPGFWIQVEPGVSGKLAVSPNISSRDVLGVTNNGEDLGAVQFNVPLANAQQFYYDLNQIGSVDFITALKFDQINNQSLTVFLAEYGGIDGIQNLDGKTLVFQYQQSDAEAGGWLRTSFFDPLNPGTGLVTGAYDTTTFDQTTEIPANERYDIWQIQILSSGGEDYIQLIRLTTVNIYDKFSILYGAQYASTQWYKNAEGIFEEIPLLSAVKDILWYQDGTDPEIFGQIRLLDQTAASQLNIEDIVGKKAYTSPNGVVFTNGLKVTFTGLVYPESYANNSYYVEGVGSAIQLLPVSNFVTPETYTQSTSVPYDSTPFDVGNYDSSLNQPLIPDYLVINRASPDQNPWSRTNRWFHIDVINAAAAYNNTIAVLDNNFRGKRPIIEFRAGTKLFDFGTQGKQPVDIIDFSATDALSNINGTIGYAIDGYNFIDGSRVIFAADTNPEVRNKIYTVQFITPDTVPPLIAQPVINLVPAADADVLINQTTFCLSGVKSQGLAFWYDGVTWIKAQQKSQTNQAPLFDVYDATGISLADRIKYPSSNFIGSKLFSYAQGTGAEDPVLGFALKYLSIANVGDILFDNNLYTDQFTYTKNKTTTTENISLGYVRQYSNRVDFVKEIGWQTGVTKSLCRQQFRFNYTGQPLLLDVAVAQNLSVPSIQIFVGSKFKDPGTYSVLVNTDRTTITLDQTYFPGDVIEVDVISSQVSKFAFYTVPVNLENNPLNQNSNQFSLGTVRNHYETICENLNGLQGPANGANNTRDLGNIVPYGLNILQQSSPMTTAGLFMRSAEYNIFNSLEYNSREYEKFKARLLDLATRNDYTNYTIPDMLTSIVAQIGLGQGANSPFYWSDMLPASSVYTQTKNTITPISTNTFDLSRSYNFTESNYQSVLVYINDKLLTFEVDYEIEPNTPRVTILAPLTTGDVVTINEYATTYGSFVPNTPTKLGLWPAWRPRIYEDTNYVVPQTVIQGHDGSITMAFGDFRDELLLEFETRIFNNLKIKSLIPLTPAEVIPGQFRKTDYSLTDINQIISTDFLSWIGWNKLNYQTQDFNINNEFTWNYSACGNVLTGPNESPLPVGAWRGLYQWFYDTASPNTTPWEMLGFSIEPAWWEDVYGAAPYTRDNLVLWDDLEAGKVADPAGEYYRPQYARPGLTKVIPTGPSGELLSPFDSVVGYYDPSSFQKSWVVGDQGPVEYSWRKSSSYPFAVMRLLALTRPAEFFSLFIDRDLYKFDLDFQQYLYNGRYRLDANGVQVYGDGTSKASYINWIVDYNQQLGINSTNALTSVLSRLDVRLTYRLGAFSDKQYLKVLLERSSPDSTNSSLLLPDDSYDLLFYKNQPFERVIYSSVIVQVVDTGYAVYGYSITNPVFDILVSKTYGTKTTIAAGGESVSVPNQYTDQVVQVPYGYVFTNKTVVVDFLLSYGALLATQGLIFNSVDNGRSLNWNQMAQEFLYWANQGWETGSVINLNPSAFTISAVKPQAVVDSIVVRTPENGLLDQNRTSLPLSDIVIDRQGNEFKISSLTEQSIAFLDLKYTAYENILVFDNVSLFSDLMYDPITGARQDRIKVSATVSADWNGTLDAQGFILNNEQTIRPWAPNVKYTKGEIVNYKGNYWSAQTIVQPKIEFDYNDWVKSDYTKIQRGLLLNAPNQSNQLANSYSVYNANLEIDQDLVAYGLIGFRPRQYMTALNLDDISQVNVYSQFLKDKGTIRSVRLLGNTNTGKEVGQYDVFENWAILRGIYGASANKSFIELRLNEAELLSDPATIQVVLPQQTSIADQPILLENLWRQSYKIPNTNILPTTTIPIQDTSLPTAGYVNLNDVDITVYSLDTRLSLAPGVLETIGIGTTVWAAKVNSYDWNVYRCTAVPGFLNVATTNLDLTSQLIFTQQHGLSVGDIIIVRYFDATVDGVYTVLGVPNPNTIVVELSLPRDIQSNGVVVVLKTMRVAQASDAVNLSYVNEFIAGSKIWVDNNGYDLWTVLEKQSPFSVSADIAYPVPVPNSKFGASVSQGKDNLVALVGSPGYSSSGSGTQVGAVYAYLRDNFGEYGLTTVLNLGTTGTLGYGNAVDVGQSSWMAAGASASNSNQGYASVIYRPAAANTYEQRQLLVAPDQDFTATEYGYSVSVSQDERWLYIGAPGGNKVYAYGRVDIEDQSVRFTTTGTTAVYAFGNAINFDVANPEQLLVTYNNKLLDYGIDYSVTASSITLSFIPPQGQALFVARKQGQQLDRKSYYGVTQTSTTGIGTGAEFTVTNIRGVYTAIVTNGGSNYAVGNTLTISGVGLGTDYSGTTAVYPKSPTSPANDLVITVTSVTTGAITGFTVSGSGITNNTVFGVAPYLFTATDIYSLTVTVDGVLQRPFIDYDFNTDSASFDNEIVFNTLPPAGATISVLSATYFKPVATLSVNGLDPDARFGSSITQSVNGRQILIGAPMDDSATVDNSGTVYAFDRGAIRYIVDDTAVNTFTLPAGWTTPVAVILNNQYLEDSDQYINGQYSVSGSTVTITAPLAVGDIVEIENNIFTQIQKINAKAPFSEDSYGFSVDMCPNSCSVYIGSPTDSTVLTQAGSVERRVNQSRLYGMAVSVANPSLIAGDTLRINNQIVTVPAVPNNTITGLAAAINASGIPNVYATVSNSTLVIGTTNPSAAAPFDKLSVLPGPSGTAFDDLGFETYAYTQTIQSPNPVLSAKFGYSVNIDSGADNLVVGAPRGNLYEPTTFDAGQTYFDDRSTVFSNTVTESGVVYTFDYLPSANTSVVNPGKFIFGQQVYNTSVQSYDQWGSAVSYVSKKLLVGAPGSDLGDSSVNYGRVAQFLNVDNKLAWQPIHIQTPVADTQLINSVYMYNRLDSSQTYFFDFINPLQGKILGAARQNIDFIATYDPAQYNVGGLNNNGNYWDKDHVGQIWWDITSVRFIDPSQNDISYASRRWAQTFPNSKVEIYQWTESLVPPAQYTGPGSVKNTTSYTVRTALNNQGTFTTYYYFWVTGLDFITSDSGKTLSTNGIARYIENPRSSGIPYLAALDANTVAIYNGLQYLSAADTILHIGYDREYTDDNVHTEYELVARGKPDSFLSANLYRKLQDSFCGVNSVGAAVPDTGLAIAERYGVQFRPRQSMFVNRFTALENYLTRANAVLSIYPIVETRTFFLLNSSEPEPSAASGEWDKRLETYDQLSYQNLNSVPLGYRYLVASDSTNNGLWAIYVVVQPSGLLSLPRTTLLTKVQTYDTRKYWQHIDWYEPGYNRSATPVAEVPNYNALASISVPVGASVKVTANSQHKWEIYQRSDIGWDRVALQDGTIEFKEELWNYAVGNFGFDVDVFDSQYFDQEPVIETRKIIQAINEELFIAELAIERNNLLMLMFDYILSEQPAPEWLTKTSLIDVNHKIRQLLPYQNYLRDNQDFVLDYIKEVKPYHVQIREFNLTYDGFDAYSGDLTDFDVPAYYDRMLTVPQYISPILLPYTKSSAVGTGTPTDIADTPPDAEIWTKWPYTQWYNNYLLSIQDVVVTDSGYGYTVAPDVVVTGDCVVPAIMQAVINSAGRVVAVNVIDPGQGYSTTAIITFTGGNGHGAKAVTVMGNSLVRSIKTTIKYDRYQYTSSISDWQANVVYLNGTQVRYNNRVWQANNTSGPSVVSTVFDPEQWQLINASTLSGVDRTQGFYTADVNEPGLDLPLLIPGIAYPGVQVMGLNFNQNTGFDIGNFDINPFDNISYGPEGRPTYDPGVLDTIYQSFYGTPATGPIPTGTAFTDIDVDGGEYVDTYSSHAPEELVPGAEFDTLDFRVYTRQGSDWEFDGHGFQEKSLSFVYSSGQQSINYSEALPYPIQLVVYNDTLGLELVPNIHYTVDWVAKTVSMIGGVTDGETVSVYVYSIGGGNQLYRNTYIGNQITNNSVTIPVSYNEIIGFGIFVNGVSTNNYTYESLGSNKTQINFGQTYTSTDYISLTAMGMTTAQDGSTQIDYSWSTAVKQTIIGDGSTLTFDLDNSVEYTNPVNLVVTVNGVRARTSSCIEYYGDGSSAFLLPSRLGFSEALISNNEVLVWINNIAQIYGVDFVLEPWTGSSRQVVFAVTPEPTDKILIGVVTNAQARVNGTTLMFDPTQGLVPNLGDIIEVTTWNDTRQQDILTTLFVGPVDTTIAVVEGYDDVNYDSASVSFTSGSYDYASNPIVQANNFVLQRPVIDPSRLWVTLNGFRQSYGEDFTIANGNEIVLASGIINAADTLIVTQFTDSTVPEAMAFRVFQDMRGLQSTYRITDNSTTTLVQNLSSTDNIIYVADASVLDEPDLSSNIWGSITINGERINYRERDIVNNTVSSLRRGTAGTGAADHDVGSLVYSIGSGQYLPQQFQNYIENNYFLADGSTTVFVADDIEFNLGETALAQAAVEVYVGGSRVTSGYTITAIAPVTVLFDTAPTQGYGVNILVRRGVTWYAPGAGTPSNGQPLQDTNTQAARFLRGL